MRCFGVCWCVHLHRERALAQESGDPGSNPSSVAIEFCDLWQHAPSGSENMSFLPAFPTVISPEGMCGHVGM